MSSWHKTRWITVLLFGITVTLFLHTLPYEFLSVDDNIYVYENDLVLDGISAEGIRSAFLSRVEGYWMPATIISLMIDSSLWGTSPWGYRLTNILLHGANSALVFLFLCMATKSRGGSFWVALLFAIHPMRVESVVWISERKDVLSGFWGFLSLLFYMRYAKSGRRTLLAASGFSLVIGLMAKPILVTWPFLFLLMDWWPLNRIKEFPPKLHTVWTCIWEKFPLFLIIILFSVLTWSTQQDVGAIRSVMDVSLSQRIAGIAPHYLHYLIQTLRFSQLSIYHTPQPEYAAGLVTVSILILSFVTALCLYQIKTAPALLVGWLWFLGILFPVIGIVRAGAVAVADRFTYIPHVGLFGAMVWGGHLFLAKITASAPTIFAALKWALPSILGGYFLIHTVLYSKTWTDSISVLDHALLVDGPSEFVMNNLGVALNQAGQTSRAESILLQALRETPHSHVLLNNLGMVYLNKQDPRTAIQPFRQAFRLDPDNKLYPLNLAMAHRASLELEPARLLLEELIERDPDNPQVHYELGRVLFHQQEWDEAAPHFSKAIQLHPKHQEALYAYGIVLNHLEQHDEAISILERALLQHSDPSIIYFQLALAYEKLSQPRQAIDYYYRILDKDPAHISSLNNIAWILATRPEFDQQHAEDAIRLAQKAIAQTQEPQPALLNTLAAAYAAGGHFTQAVQQAETALALATDSGQTNLMHRLENRIELYRSGYSYQVITP